MELTIRRQYKKETYTIGKLYIDGIYFCDTIEDCDRGLRSDMPADELRRLKVPGKTAIPYGRYGVTLSTISQRFSKVKAYAFCKGYLPRVLGVPCFDGILFHIGNWAKDTDGCILVGENKVKGGVANSTTWFKKFYDVLKSADDRHEEIWVTIIP